MKVYVPKRRNIKIAVALFDVEQNEKKWPEDDPDRPNEDDRNAINSEEITEMP